MTTITELKNLAPPMNFSQKLSSFTKYPKRPKTSNLPLHKLDIWLAKKNLNRKPMSMIPRITGNYLPGKN